MKYRIHSEDSTRIHITGRRTGEQLGCVRIFRDGQLLDEAYYKFSGFETFLFSWEKEQEYEIEIKDLEVSLAYFYCPDTVLKEGVRFIEFKDEVHIYKKENLKEALTQDYRNSFHFSPYKNWMNDPNGLCYFKGCYHLFYQYNPNGQKWGNMHWGHAVSKDMVHWVHQPVAAYPQIELNGCEGQYRGGAFSGSAVIEDDVMHLFYTRHFGKTDRSWQRQWQVTKWSSDGVHFTHEECAVWGTPEGVTWHFRDPKLVKLDRKWNMILAGSCYDRPAVFRYESEDLKNWEYKGILYGETDPQYGIAECPDFFVLDDTFVLIVSYIYADGRKDGRNVVWYTGTYKDGRFYPEKNGLLDEGKDFYAPQSFEHEGERISVGWNCHRLGQHIVQSGGSNGSLSLPRRLTVKNQKLYSQVIPQVQNLFIERKEGEPYFLSMKASEEITDQAEKKTGEVTEISLADSPTGKIKLYLSSDSLRVALEKTDTVSEALAFECEVKADSPLKKIEAYVDKAILELFINDGEQVCTRRFYLPEAALRPVPENADGWSFEIKGMRSIW